jgi:hypothetical protein
LVKVTTASTEGAAPYTSTGDLYNGRYLDDSTERTKESSGLAVWTAHATAVDEWLFAVQTPLGHWEGVAFYDWVKVNQQGYMYANGVSTVQATIPLAYAEAYSALEIDEFQDLAVSYVVSADEIRSDSGGYIADLARGVLRYECGSYAGRRLRRVRFPYVLIDSTLTPLTGLTFRIGIYTSDTIPTTIGAWQTSDGNVEIVDDGGAYTEKDGQIICDIELQDYLFISVIIDEATSPAATGNRIIAPWDVSARYPAFPVMRISLGLEPVI